MKYSELSQVAKDYIQACWDCGVTPRMKTVYKLSKKSKDSKDDKRNKL